ncbi:MAG TPA: fibronectin type III domain-containing protein [Bacillota bacterium]|nr:fibronectin type III domain-containing protein [Bacillota bacterium]
MKKIISIAVATAMVVTLASGTAFAGNGYGNSRGASQKDFKDMKGHWGYQSVQKMQNYGIFDGYSDGTFRPDQALNEAELAVLIERLVDYRQGSDESDNRVVMNTGSYGSGWGAGYNWGIWGSWGSWGNQSFYNVPAWAQQAVWKGAYNRYLNPGSFNPNTNCDRITAIVAIAKALGLEPEPVYTYNPFSDGKLIADEDLGYVLAMYNEGYISGYPDGSFNPNATLTRAQMASIIEKLLENMGGKDTDDDNAPTWAKDSEITASNVKDTSVTLKWSGAKDDVKVTGYKVIYKVDGKEKTKTVTDRTVTVTGLAEDTKYTFTVEARDAAGNWSDDGPSVSVTTADTDDEDNDSDAPYWSGDSAVTATAVNVDSVELKWSGAKDDVKVTGYKVIYKVDGKEKTKTVTDKTATVTGLTEDTKYTFTVEARDAAGNWSTDGPSVKVTTLAEDEDTKAPTWPRDASLTVSQSSSGIVTIVWPEADDNVGVTAYKIYQDGNLIKTVDEDTTNINVKGLKEDTEYTFKVKAADAAGNLSSGLTYSYTTD